MRGGGERRHKKKRGGGGKGRKNGGVAAAAAATALHIRAQTNKITNWEKIHSPQNKTNIYVFRSTS